MSSPIVRQQIDQINAAQARKDAASGRRSNMAGSAPATMAAAGGVINDYLKGFSPYYSKPDAATLAQMYSGSMPALTMGNQGNAPFYSAAGSIMSENRLNDLITEALAKQRGEA